VARLSDDELSSGESAALECSGEPDPDLIPIATFDPTGNSIAHDRGTGDSSRNGVRGCDVNVGKRGEGGGPKAKRSRFGKETKSDKRQKVLIETETLAILVCSYNHHFSDYYKGRRHVTQRIPSKVWKSVYTDFLEKAREFAAANGEVFNERLLPVERTLQDSLRSALDEQDTGTPDEKGAAKVTLQCENTLQRLKRADGHATRNMLRLRNDMIDGNVQSSSTESPASRATTTILGVSLEPPERAAPSDEVARRQTRLEIQNRTADASTGLRVR
jgi:hypothetical protein